jgi:hypothetical protein
MNNLTDYELLQHRHLSLLRVLQDKGVTCVMGAQGWEVTMPKDVKCTVCMDTRRVRHDPIGTDPCPECACHIACPVDFSGESPFGGYRTTSARIDANFGVSMYSLEMDATAKHPASKDVGQWAMTINVDEKTHKWGVAIGDTVHTGLPYTSLMAGLLSALRAAIMDATSAKA